MKRVITYILALAAIAACQEKMDSDKPQLTTVTLCLNAADPAGETDSKAVAPLIPDVENLIHDVWVIQYSERGVLYTGVDKFYRTSGEDGARYVTLQAQVMSGKSTICIIANLKNAKLPTREFFDVESLQASLPDNLPQFKNTLLNTHDFLWYINTNYKPIALPMFGYWEGTIDADSPEIGSESLNVTLGRMFNRVNVTVANNSGSTMKKIRFTNAAAKSYYFPQINSEALPDDAYCTQNNAIETVWTIPSGNEGTMYFYWAANFCYGPQKATRMSFTMEDGSEYSCLLTNGPVTDENPDYNLYHNCNYTVTVTLE